VRSQAVLREEGSRAEELKALGWPPEKVRRYEELWEYRQRWGAINLERDDRVFLREAEAALPRRVSGRGAQKKATKDKSHYRWLAFYLEAMTSGEQAPTLAEGEEGAWAILLEEELKALDYYEPVLGLPDTLRTKAFLPERERWAALAAAEGRLAAFDFLAPLTALKASGPSPWKPLRGESTDSTYPVLAGEAAQRFRRTVRQEVLALTRRTYPSLADTTKPEPTEDASA